MCVCILCIYNSLLFCLEYVEGLPMSTSCQGTWAFMTCESEWVWRSLKAGWGSRFMRQPVYHGWFLCCEILWNLSINSFSLERAYKQWWNPWGAAVPEYGHRQHLSLRLFQMVFWVTSQHWCNAEKRSPGLTNNDFQKQTKPVSWRNAFALKKKSTRTSPARQ